MSAGLSAGGADRGVPQQWYALSEEVMADRRSFRRFMGLAPADPVPDYSTLWRFREQPGQSGLAEAAVIAITGLNLSPRDKRRLRPSALKIEQAARHGSAMIRKHR